MAKTENKSKYLLSISLATNIREYFTTFRLYHRVYFIKKLKDLEVIFPYRTVFCAYDEGSKKTAKIQCLCEADNS